MTAAIATKPPSRRGGLAAFFPILGWLPRYERGWLRSDLIAGLTVMALLVPEGMAYAELAGMPPQTIFYAAPAALLLYAIFGTSRQLVVVVSSVQAVMSYSIVSALAPPGTSEFIVLSSALAITAGVVSVLAGVLHLGRIAQFFSASVLTGFVSGLAVVVAVKQLPKLFGIEAGTGNVWERLYDLLIHLPETHMLTLVVGISSIAVMLLIEHYMHRIPAALVAMVFGIVVSTFFGLSAYGVHVVGEIPAGLAPPKLPGITVDQWLSLMPGALALALVNFAEGIGPARSFATKYRYSINPNQELIGLGAANLGAGLFQGFPIGSSLSKSAANEAAGAKSQMSGIVAAGLTDPRGAVPDADLSQPARGHPGRHRHRRHLWHVQVARDAAAGQAAPHRLCPGAGYFFGRADFRGGAVGAAAGRRTLAPGLGLAHEPGSHERTRPGARQTYL